MGLKLLTLAYCSVTGKRVRLHTTGEVAHVIAVFVKETKKMSYSLRFSDGRIDPVSWSQDNQGYVAKGGAELDEVDDTNSALLV